MAIKRVVAVSQATEVRSAPPLVRYFGGENGRH